MSYTDKQKTVFMAICNLLDVGEPVTQKRVMLLTDIKTKSNLTRYYVQLHDRGLIVHHKNKTAGVDLTEKGKELWMRLKPSLS